MNRLAARRWLLGLCLVDLLSFLGHYLPSVEVASFALLALGFLVLCLWRFEIAVLVALAELFVGSQGHLFALTVGGASVPIRLAFFLVLTSVGGWRLVRFDGIRWLWQLRRPLAPIAALLLVVGGGFWNGLRRGYGFNDVLFDGNAYLYLGFVVPLLAVRQRDFYDQAVSLLILAASFLAAKTLLLLYFFTHHFGFFLPDLYQWIRDSGVGELTPTTTGAYRIFLQSQIYILVAWWVVLWRGRGTNVHPGTATTAALLVLFGGALLVSFSRSLWFGLAVSFLAFTMWTLWRQEWGAYGRVAGYVAVSLVGGFFLVILILHIPFPQASSSGELRLEDRFELEREAAASSRWNLLPPLWAAVREHPLFGAGFGTPVTYISNDPRVRSVSPSGRYTTIAFEWGYLDVWLKIGLLGLSIFGWLVWRVLWAGAAVAAGSPGGLLLGLLGLLAVHLGSPYLNHPLGLGFLLLLYGAYVLAPPLAAAERPR